MGFVNKVMLMGNTTRDPELRQLPSGTTLCDFALATNRVYKTTTGEEKQETVFIDCTAFGRTAEVIAEYCPKGRALFIEGRLHFTTWEDKSGNRRSKLSVIVESFQFVGSRESKPVQRELALSNNARDQGDRPAASATSSTARRGPGNRFDHRQRPDTAAARTARNAAGKPARAAATGSAAGGVATITNPRGEVLSDKAMDRMAEETQNLQEADLPF